MSEIHKLEGGEGTYLLLGGPWRQYVGGRVKCSDGKYRNLKRISPSADTFFSIPASVTVRGKTVAGYVGTLWSHATKEQREDTLYVFRAYQYRKNWEELPERFREEIEEDERITQYLAEIGRRQDKEISSP